MNNSIYLQPFSFESTDHLLALFRFRNSEEYISYCTGRTLVDYELFLDEIEIDFNRDKHSQSMILHKQYGIVGTVWSYNYNINDNYVYSSIFIENSYIKHGFGPSALLKFCDYLFESTKLYKIYFEVYEYNSHSIKILSRVAECEGVFKKQKLHNSARFDVYRFAFYGDTIIKWKNKHDGSHKFV